MTVLLVMFLFLAFVGTDHVVRLASRRAAARRAAQREAPTGAAVTAYAELTKRAIG